MARTVRRNLTRKEHIPNGYPHYSTAHEGYCLCLDECCQGDDGCVCKTCECQWGMSHMELVRKTINDPQILHETPESPLHLSPENER